MATLIVAAFPSRLSRYSRVMAKIVRVEASAFAVAFIHSFDTRVALIRHFYAGGYAKPLGAIKAAKVGTAVLRRLLD
jgi:hypothetical protein